MSTDADLNGAATAISFIAVNGAGYENGLSQIAEEGSLPVVQDTSDVNAWQQWDANWRDVIVIGPTGEKLFVYNLTEHDLGDSNSRADLKQLLLDAAAAQ